MIAGHKKPRAAAIREEELYNYSLEGTMPPPRALCFPGAHLSARVRRTRDALMLLPFAPPSCVWCTFSLSQRIYTSREEEDTSYKGAPPSPPPQQANKITRRGLLWGLVYTHTRVCLCERRKQSAKTKTKKKGMDVARRWLESPPFASFCLSVPPPLSAMTLPRPREENSSLPPRCCCCVATGS